MILITLIFLLLGYNQLFAQEFKEANEIMSKVIWLVRLLAGVAFAASGLNWFRRDPQEGGRRWGAALVGVVVTYFAAEVLNWLIGA